MSTSEIIATSVTVLAILGKIYDFYNSKSYKEAKEEQLKAKEAQIILLKEQVEFLTKHNDDYLTKKYKSQIKEFKKLIESNENSVFDSQLKDFETTIAELQHHNISLLDKLKINEEQYEVAEELMTAMSTYLSVLSNELQKPQNKEMQIFAKKELQKVLPNMEALADKMDKFKSA